MTRNRLAFAAAVLAAAVQFHAGAQEPAPRYTLHPPGDQKGTPALALALRKLTTTGTLMQTTAHPDDENNATLALYARHVGMRVALVTATRGDGGQNEIGPELFDALGILRTEELLAAHRYDGAEQYFTRAVDFGYSFSADETLEKWGRQEILGDFVRHIRTLRPDVMVSLGVDGAGGGQHHQTSGILSAEAFAAAADPARFPEQIAAGLRPWQVKKLYRPAGGFGGRGGRGGPPGRGGGAGRGGPAGQIPSGPGAGPESDPNARYATLDTNRYDPMLGCTIGELGAVAAGLHMCQGRVPRVPAPGPTSARYRLVDTSVPSLRGRDETSLFDGLDTSVVGLARFAGQRQHDNLIRGLAIISSRVASAREALTAGGPAATVPELTAGLAAVRGLRAGLPSVVDSDEGRFEIDFRLQLKEVQFQDALELAQSLRIDATADDGLIVAGQPVRVAVAVANRGPGTVAVRSVTLNGFAGQVGCDAGAATLAAPFACAVEGRVPDEAVLTGPYWERPENGGRAVFAPEAAFGLPFRPSPFTARIELDVAGTVVVRERPIQFKYDGAGLAGEKRMELKVVPAFSVSVSPDVVVVPLRAATPARGASAPNGGPGREGRVTVVNGRRGPASATVRMTAPAGWRVTPQSAPLAFTREDEAVTTRFTVAPSGTPAAGTVTISAEVVGQGGGTPSATGYRVIEYPHIQRRHALVPAAAIVKVMDVAVAPALSVGYVMGVGDQVPQALRQLGATVTLLDTDDLAWGDLTRFHTIVTGVRAYERRDDLKAHNDRLLRYVEQGGTVVVQYNKMEFNSAQYGPFAASVSSNRITDEQAPVNVLVPSHPVFTWPNRIDEAAWAGWVQERGLYFLGEKSDRYVDLVEMTDPFEGNKGTKRGALVEARHGKGRWLYVGLGLWRQLPAGTDGAYRLMANLVSLGKTPQ